MPHKSYIKLRGLVVGKDDSRIKTGNTNGKPYKSINFGTKTHPKQIIYVEKFASKPDFAYAWSKSEKKTMKIAYDKRNDKLPNGYRLIIPDWDNVEDIIANFKNEDSVVIIGELDFQEYNDKLFTKQVIKNIYKATEEVNFEAEDFEEIAIFNQEMTVNSVEVVKDEGKIYLNVWIFKNRGKEKPVGVIPAVFTVDINKNKKFSSKIARLKLGDTFKADGIILNRVETQTIEQDEEWGTVNQVIKTTVKEYQITGVHGDNFQEKLYKEKDILDAIEKLNEEKIFQDDEIEGLIEDKKTDKENNNKDDDFSFLD